MWASKCLRIKIPLLSLLFIDISELPVVVLLDSGRDNVDNGDPTIATCGTS